MNEIRMSMLGNRPQGVAILLLLVLQLTACGGGKPQAPSSGDTTALAAPVPLPDTAAARPPELAPLDTVAQQFATPEALGKAIVMALRRQDSTAYIRTLPTTRDLLLAHFEAGIRSPELDAKGREYDGLLPQAQGMAVSSMRKTAEMLRARGLNLAQLELVAAEPQMGTHNGLSYALPLRLSVRAAQQTATLEIGKALHGPSGWFGGMLRLAPAS